MKIENEESRVSRRRAARKDDACAHGTRAAFMPRVGGALTGKNPLLHDPPALGLEGLDGGRDARKVSLRDVVRLRARLRDLARETGVERHEEVPEVGRALVATPRRLPLRRGARMTKNRVTRILAGACNVTVPTPSGRDSPNSPRPTRKG